MVEPDPRELAEALPQIVWTTNAHGRALWINQRWTDVTGLSREAALDDGALAAMHPDDRAEVQRLFREGFNTGSPVEIEYRLRTAVGSYRWHLARMVPVFADGAIARWIGSAFDIEDRREAETARRMSDTRFETVFQLCPQPMAIARISDGKFLRVNDAFMTLFAAPHGGVLQRNSAEVGLVDESGRSALRTVLRGAERVATAITLQTGTGGRIEVVLTTAQIDFDGDRCWLGVANDVTAQRAAETALRQSEARARARAEELEALMDAVPAAVWITYDRECREMTSNRAGNELLRIPPGVNMSKTGNPGVTRHLTMTADGKELPTSELPVHRAARGIEVRRFEEEVRFDDGSVAHLFGSAVPLRDPRGEPRGAIGAFVDVTQIKQAQAVMREADRRKDEFLAMLSHELRNPLSPIITAAQLMELRGDAASAPEREVILRQARHLLRLVDDLLDVSRVASGKVTLNKQYMGFATAITSAVEATRPLFEAQRHRLTLDISPRGLAVEGDETRLTQVISNLLTNAARYTPQGGHVEVRAAREGDEVVLRVRDNGPGIDPSLREHIFDMFVQGARGPDRAEGGLGLGLFLVRILTELHGGSVHAASEGVGYGSEFTVRLPAAIVRPAQATPPVPMPVRPRVNARIERILIVDDNQDGARTIATLLATGGHDVRVAFDPSEALATAAAFKPQVAIVDIGLPVMDGYALGRELRARLEVPPILIALTGYGQEGDRRRSAEAGFAAHLVKPIYLEALVEVLAAI